MFFFFSSRRRHTRSLRDWSSDVCSSDLFVNAYPIYTSVSPITQNYTPRMTRIKIPIYSRAPWHFLNFLPEPHGQGSLRPGIGISYLTVGFFSSSPVTKRHCPSSRSNRLFSRWSWSSPACDVNRASNDTNALLSLTCFVSRISSPRHVDVSDHSRIKTRSISL